MKRRLRKSERVKLGGSHVMKTPKILRQGGFIEFKKDRTGQVSQQG